MNSTTSREPFAQNGPDSASVLIVGNYRPSLTVVRSLAQCGYRTIVGTQGVCFSHRSRACAEVWSHPPIDADPPGFIAALNQFLVQRQDVRAVFPVSEEAVVRLARDGSAIPATVRAVMPTPEIVEACLDKTGLLQCVQALDVPTQPFVLARDHATLRGFGDRHGYPCVVRPTIPGARIGNKKALIVESSEDLDAQLPSWPSGQPSLLIQLFAAGARHNVYFLADRGHVLASGEVKILRTDRADGTGLAVEGVTLDTDPSLHRHIQRIVEYFGYSGLGCGQFHVDDSTGDVAFLELNPRLGANFALVHHAGLPLAPLACELTLRGSTDVAAATWRTDLRYAWLYGDLSGLLESIRCGDLSNKEAARWFLRAIKSSFAADIHLTWSLTDPLPTLLTYADTALDRARAFSRAHRRAVAKQSS